MQELSRLKPANEDVVVDVAAGAAPSVSRRAITRSATVQPHLGQSGNATGIPPTGGHTIHPLHQPIS